MNKKGKITLVIILSVILLVCIAFAVVLTLGDEPSRVPTVQTEAGTEETIGISEPISETTDVEVIVPQKEEVIATPEDEPATELETESAMQMPTQPESSIQPTEVETPPATEVPTDPTQPVEGGKGNAEWGNAGAED